MNRIFPLTNIAILSVFGVTARLPGGKPTGPNLQ